METICCIGKLYGDVGAFVVWVALRAICQNIVHEILTDTEREELMDDDPLVVPSHQALRLAEDIFLLHTLVSQVVDNRVMKFQEGQVKLRNDEVNVISRITEQCPALAIPGKVLHLISIVQAKQEFIHVVDIIKVGTTRWLGSIHGLY